MQCQSLKGFTGKALKYLLRKGKIPKHLVEQGKKNIDDLSLPKNTHAIIKGGVRNPIPPKIKEEAEDFFEEDFSEVKVHNDKKSHDLASELNAKAFTTGKDVFFGKDEFKPQTKEGKELIGHELTHVVQQRKSNDKFIQRKLIVESPFGKIFSRDPHGNKKGYNIRLSYDFLQGLLLDFTKNLFFITIAEKAKGNDGKGLAIAIAQKIGGSTVFRLFIKTKPFIQILIIKKIGKAGVMVSPFIIAGDTKIEEFDPEKLIEEISLRILYKTNKVNHIYVSRKLKKVYQIKIEGDYNNVYNKVRATEFVVRSMLQYVIDKGEIPSPLRAVKEYKSKYKKGYKSLKKLLRLIDDRDRIFEEVKKVFSKFAVEKLEIENEAENIENDRFDQEIGSIKG